MTLRAWVFKPSLLVAIVAMLAAYSIVAEAADFHLIGLKHPSASPLNHRLRECLVLWFVVCFVVGWTLCDHGHELLEAFGGCVDWFFGYDDDDEGFVG